ncbi:DevR family CRISPR-associated autoregulator [Fodinibius sediminis]|uniref:CRISPR-associated autoregulator, Csa2 family n=1 Tax=Fodinibius sediminis TaxID=1214077 RepID=A0A521DTV5_9BACT|nr:DevR family CRISPR-associated autoregulator [Fodinibius sediminis]SMO75146.1 CRISPR-associated autoregulator, Csa2 family [Fodinibius sediminis]
MDIQKIQNLTLVGRLSINLASLNNEGTEGNATQPRTATIVDEGELYTVPVISGDMLKYWHVKHLCAIAQDRELPLSENNARKNPNPNRLKAELAKHEWVVENIPEAEDWSGKLKNEKKDALEQELYRLVAESCTVTDAHGLLITEVAPSDKSGDNVFKGSVAVSRTSRIQTGFMTGIPRKNATGHYFHAKYVSKRTGIKSRDTSGNEGQNIFTRPATSADFAVVINVDLAGLGFNDAANEYVVDEDEQAKRKKAVLDALSYTLMNQPGANSSQQFPHIMGFEGAITTSTNRSPAPSASPIKEDYLDTLEGLVNNINKMNEDKSASFDKIGSVEEAVAFLSN